MKQVLFPEALMQQIRAHVNSRPMDVEQGGLLLGLRKGESIEVCDATFPQPWDVATPLRFYRSEKGHSEKALREWERSGKTIDWIGEWHTHPSGLARPSFIDQKTWIDIVRHTKQDMVFIILGSSSTFIGCQAMEFHTVKSLSIVSCDCGYKLYS